MDFLGYRIMSIDHEWHEYFKVMQFWSNCIRLWMCKAMNSTAICEGMISMYDYRKAEILHHYYDGTI